MNENNNNITQEQVLNSIEINLKNNKELSNDFNMELYKEIREEIINMKEEDLGVHHGR